MSAPPLFAVNEFSTVVVGVLGVLVLVLALGPPQNPEHDHPPKEEKRREGSHFTPPKPSRRKEAKGGKSNSQFRGTGLHIRHGINQMQVLSFYVLSSF